MLHKRIWKHSMDSRLIFEEESYAIQMPRGAHIIDVQTSKEFKPGISTSFGIDMWAEHYVKEGATKPEMETRFFKVFATGRVVPMNSKYVGTVRPKGTELVFHVYEIYS